MGKEERSRKKQNGVIDLFCYFSRPVSCILILTFAEYVRRRAKRVKDKLVANNFYDDIGRFDISEQAGDDNSVSPLTAPPPCSTERLPTRDDPARG